MDILCRLTSVLTFRVLTVKSFRKLNVVLRYTFFIALPIGACSL